MTNQVRQYLIDGISQESDVRELESKLGAAREGMYVCGVKAAIKAGDKESFMSEVEKLENDCRTNARGIAEKYGIAQAKDTHGELKTDEDGNPIYKVPSSLSTVKSVLGKAFDEKIDMGTIRAPVSFGKIRTTLRDLQAARAGSESTTDAPESTTDAEPATQNDAPPVLTGDAKRRAEGRDLLYAVAESLDGYSGKVLTAILKLIRALAKFEPEEAEEPKPESRKGTRKAA